MPRHVDPPKLYASIYLTFHCFSLMFILLALSFDYINTRNTRIISKNERITKYFMRAIIISNGIFQIIRILEGTICACTAVLCGLVTLLMVCKYTTYGFFVHRAKLAQGMTPICGQKCFEKRLPILMVILFVFWVSLSNYGAIKSSNWKVCIPYEDTSDVIRFCSKTQVVQVRGILITIAFETILAIALLLLFVVPLYRVYQTDLGSLNEAQKGSRNKLKLLLIWSTSLSFINMASSIIFLIAQGMKPDASLLVYIGSFDPAINVWTSWLMIAQNRRFMKRLQCGQRSFQRGDNTTTTMT